MSVRQENSFIYTCYKCQQEHIQRNSVGYYTQSVLPFWLEVTYQFSSQEQTLRHKMLLCTACKQPFVNLLEDHNEAK